MCFRWNTRQGANILANHVSDATRTRVLGGTGTRSRARCIGGGWGASRRRSPTGWTPRESHPRRHPQVISKFVTDNP